MAVQFNDDFARVGDTRLGLGAFDCVVNPFGACDRIGVIRGVARAVREHAAGDQRVVRAVDIFADAVLAQCEDVSGMVGVAPTLIDHMPAAGRRLGALGRVPSVDQVEIGEGLGTDLVLGLVGINVRDEQSRSAMRNAPITAGKLFRPSDDLLGVVRAIGFEIVFEQRREFGSGFDRKNVARIHMPIEIGEREREAFKNHGVGSHGPGTIKPLHPLVNYVQSPTC